MWFQKGQTLRNAYENPELFEYYQVKNAKVNNNTIIACKEAFNIGSGKDSKSIVPPTNIEIVDNTIITPKTLITYKSKPTSSKISGNQVEGASLTVGFVKMKDIYVKNIYNLFSLQGGDEKPFWMTESIGPAWFKNPFQAIIK